MATETTYDLDTELSSVNSILASIGQSPVTTLDFTNPEISYVYQLLMEANQDTQNEGWVFNREGRYPIAPNAACEIIVPKNVLRMDVWENAINRTTNVVQRGGKLYNKIGHTYEFDETIYCDIVWLFPFTELPNVFKRYITARASVRAATQMVTNRELAQALALQEGYLRASCMEYECNQGDPTMFGTPQGTIYRSYQPYNALAR